MGDKVCLITGGNSGIGRAAAIQLAQKGINVVIGCRSEERGITAQKRIIDESGNDAVEVLIVDMSSQTSIKNAADEFKSGHGKLDVLIHNAADFDISRKSPEFSEENVETIWATNHIGPVLLTDLLLDELKASDQGRVITVASRGLVLHPFLKVDLEDPEFRSGGFSVEKAYYQSKLAQVMYTYWLADGMKSSKVTANCVRVTNVKVDISRYPNLPSFMKRMYSVKSKFSISPERMAGTYVYLALSEALNGVTGKYFDHKNRPISSSAYSKDKKNIGALMDLTMKYIRTA